MLLKDCAVHSPRIDSSENLVFTLKIKKSDYTDWMRQFIFDCYNQWKTLDLEVVWLEEKNDEIPKLRQRLAMVMEEYAQKTKFSIVSVKENLYIRYGIESRTELTREQLEEAIRFYSDWILYDTNF